LNEKNIIGLLLLSNFYFQKKDVLKEFGTLEQFEKEMKEGTPKYAEFEIDFGKCDREEDWWQYGKGGYDVEHKLIKND
jgi:hypothetical protein